MRDVIQSQFSLEILLKHNELRLVEQELSKCQVALEQLRRCHLLPYPTACPTPQQMLDISSGRGAAVRRRPGEAVPRWAPPFGVVDGPYARHYAKWLIPDPVFDGVLPEWHGIPLTAAQQRVAAEGRTTRNSTVVVDVAKNRTVRGVAGQKLQALSSGYPQTKDKAGPCVLKRQDGKTVKLVCIDCHRENFSSTQGFINHCRIAHKRDFKSHEEAAVHSGHPIEVDEMRPLSNGDPAPAPVERPAVAAAAAATLAIATAPVVPAVPSGFAHPLARPDRETCDALLSRIDASLKMFDQGRLPGVRSIPAAAVSSVVSPAKPPRTATSAAAAFVASDKTPYLSRLLQGKNFGVDLGAHVDDVQMCLDFEDMLSPDDDSEEGEHGDSLPAPAVGVRTPAVSRVPVRPIVAPTKTPAAAAAMARPAGSSKGHSPHLAFALPADTSARIDGSSIFEDDEMDVDMSPNTATSNNAPSLVSDDGEYDDSDDGSSSEVDDSEDESVSDVAEINIAEDEVQGHESPRGLRHHRATTGAAVKLKKEEPKHVPFVSPIRRSTPKARRAKKL